LALQNLFPIRSGVISKQIFVVVAVPGLTLVSVWIMFTSLLLIGSPLITVKIIWISLGTILKILTSLLYLGLSRLPLAFGPTVTDRVKFGRRVDKIDYSKSANKVTFSWRNNYRDRNHSTAEYDYALVAAPFSMVRKLRKPGLIPPPQLL